MRAAKANSTLSAIGQMPRKMINQVMTAARKCNFHNPRHV
jgi:hypothetical protein